MPSLTMIVVATITITGLILFYRLVLADFIGNDKRVLAAVVVAVAVGIFLINQGNKRPPNKATQLTTVNQEDSKLAPQPTPEELEAKRQAEEKRAAEQESKRQQEAERQRQIAEEKAARKAERAANRMTTEDFDWRFMENVNVFVDAAGLNHVDHMGTPERRSVGVDETLTYSLDLDGDLSITEVTNNGRIKGAKITIHRMNQGSMLAAVVFYNALVQVFVTAGEANSIFYGLHLDDTFFDDGKKTRSVDHKGYRYEKKFLGSKLVLSVTEE